MAETVDLPLAVDLDGTLIRTDMMFFALARLLRRNPLAIFQVLWWWARGRAWLKQQLAARVTFNPAELAYHPAFLTWLRAQKAAGRHLVLATASDLRLAQPVADHLGLFDRVLASDGRVNLRGAAKRQLLEQNFGPRGFDYAGNSSVDLAVWAGSRAAVVVNASRRTRQAAARVATLGPMFCDDPQPWAIAGDCLREVWWRSGYLPAIVAGLLLAAAFPKLGWAGFAWVAPALLLFAARHKSGADAFRAGYAGGLAFWLGSLAWLLLIPCPFLPVLGWLALAAYLALFFGVWTWGFADFDFQTSSWPGRLAWSLGGAAAWVALEMLRGWLWGGFPWNFLADSQYRLVPLIQLASVTGVYGVSFLMVWFALSLLAAAAMILRHPTRRQVWQLEIALPLLVIVAVFTAGFFRLHDVPPPDRWLQAVLIQPRIPQSVIWNPDSDQAGFEQFLADNEAALVRPADLLVWPESAVPEMNAGNAAAISDLARRHHLWLMLNGEDLVTSATATNYYNAAFLVNPQGRLAGVYHKQKLVIFGEYVPLVKWLPFLQWFTPISGGWTPGTGPVTFHLNTPASPSGNPHHIVYLGGGAPPPVQPPGVVAAAPLICYEDVFPGVARAAARPPLDFFVNLTNDGWFGDASEQWQHLASAVFRAVENGVPLVRCANNGITCLVNPQGGVEPVFRDPAGSEYGRGVLRVAIPLAAPNSATTTFYQRHGDWFAWGCVALAAGRLPRRLRRVKQA